jgi:PPK2 family polyphosphate:nucleotide phosphotransferase
MPASFAKKFIAEPGKPFKLAKIDPRDESAFNGKEATKAQIAEDAEAINEIQDRLWAENKRALLIVLQGIDTSGKDGTVRVVFNACGPLGISVVPFKAPTVDELARDFLWRAHLAVPKRGMIGIFNRSYYEDVLVVKVKKIAPPDVIEKRYQQINDFEKLLSETGTRILKFMLHISKEEQAQRLQERLDNRAKQWKFNPRDLEDRALWDDYMAAYETMVNRCSTLHAPWHVIPADRNWTRNAAVARIVRETLEAMNPQYPKPEGWDPKTVKIV